MSGALADQKDLDIKTQISNSEAKALARGANHPTLHMQMCFRTRRLNDNVQTMLRDDPAFISLTWKGASPPKSCYLNAGASPHMEGV